ncbi:helix-turn-helix domain-containing protein [Elizabethkingia anophelis]|uniref:DNA binding domain, excisionase family n=2 Tax=Elizabethkingia anophelis TaxID=1117645 RepID=A0A7Z7PYB2_9FLAO|nr:helix-turn-helix domain-containing protein [Elizabethkingia anophelis]MCT3728142.1 helix-turn-helix domain-containing protein [Elizabethkingia anophelis]MCT4006360.1 helix-turn-helix domain-containing protein [Elizabethkingia anophelis]MCT4013739.1 helix-turn-helix domain-containing protein [Elizabethkingia anophelis]MDV3473600.1 helix-turn-helix domain-containing protein [Elizabethkingia anophelis]MDV3633523.1 helix-turn-helix domain-containing protein [Elizabethkingia anophelis]
MLQLIQISKEELLQEFEQMVRKVLEKMITEKVTDEEKEYYTREETAKLLKVSFPTLFHWNKDGKLKAKKLGKRVYYSKEDVKEALNKLNN